MSKSIELDLNLIEFYDQQLGKVEWYIQKQAKVCDLHSLILLRTVSGIGEILSLVILYEIHTIDRFPTVQDCSSYRRLVNCKKESAGKGYGTTGRKIGNAYWKGRLSAKRPCCFCDRTRPLKPGWKKSPIGMTKPGP
ncbi:MAG: transposase [Methylococcales bacterium]